MLRGWHGKPKVRGPGVIVGRSSGSFGVVSYSSCDYWPLNTAFIRSVVKGNIATIFVPVRYLAISEMPVARNQGFIAMKCNGDVSNFFMFNWRREIMTEIEWCASGTTFQEISKRNLRPIPVAVRANPLVSTFDEVAGPLYCRVTANLRELQTLATAF